MFTFNGGKTVADYLLARDISKFQIRKLPENDFQKSIVNSEKTSEDKFIEQWEGLSTRASDLYKTYLEYCIEHRIHYEGNVGEFGKKLQPFVRDGILINNHPCNISTYRKP
jgi:hypothetical protein